MILIATGRKQNLTNNRGPMPIIQSAVNWKYTRELLKFIFHNIIYRIMCWHFFLKMQSCKKKKKKVCRHLFFSMKMSNQMRNCLQLRLKAWKHRRDSFHNAAYAIKSCWAELVIRGETVRRNTQILQDEIWFVKIDLINSPETNSVRTRDNFRQDCSSKSFLWAALTLTPKITRHRYVVIILWRSSFVDGGGLLSKM